MALRPAHAEFLAREYERRGRLFSDVGDIEHVIKAVKGFAKFAGELLPADQRRIAYGASGLPFLTEMLKIALRDSRIEASSMEYEAHAYELRTGYQEALRMVRAIESPDDAARPGVLERLQELLLRVHGLRSDLDEPKRERARTSNTNARNVAIRKRQAEASAKKKRARDAMRERLQHRSYKVISRELQRELEVSATTLRKWVGDMKPTSPSTSRKQRKAK